MYCTSCKHGVTSRYVSLPWLNLLNLNLHMPGSSIILYNAGDRDTIPPYQSLAKYHWNSIACWCQNEQHNFQWNLQIHLMQPSLQRNYIYASVDKTIIGSDNGLSAGPLETNFSEILVKIHIFSLTKMRLKVSSGKCRPSWIGLNVLVHSHTHTPVLLPKNPEVITWAIDDPVRGIIDASLGLNMFSTLWNYSEIPGCMWAMNHEREWFIEILSNETDKYTYRHDITWQKYVSLNEVTFVEHTSLNGWVVAELSRGQTPRVGRYQVYSEANGHLMSVSSCINGACTSAVCAQLILSYSYLSSFSQRIELWYMPRVNVGAR